MKITFELRGRICRAAILRRLQDFTAVAVTGDVTGQRPVTDLEPKALKCVHRQSPRHPLGFLAFWATDKFYFWAEGESPLAVPSRRHNHSVPCKKEARTPSKRARNFSWLTTVHDRAG